MRKFFAGVLLMLGLLLILGASVMRLGLVPVNADGSHSNLEQRIMPMALQFSIARHAPEQVNPVQVSQDGLKSAAAVYRSACKQCHGTPNGNPNLFGQSFYPPAKRLNGGLRTYTESELFWIIKHGIRNTGMPAWGNVLSDESIWQIVTLLKHSEELPPSVEAELGSVKGTTER